RTCCLDLSFFAGADGRTRTGTGFPPRDFKSLASTISPRPRAAVLASRAGAAKQSTGPVVPAKAGTHDHLAGQYGDAGVLGSRLTEETGLLLQGVAPDAVPVLAGGVGDAAVGLEELVGHLEDGEHQSALGTPGDVAAARLAPHELARPDLQPGGGPFLVHQLSFEHVGL